MVGVRRRDFSARGRAALLVSSLAPSSGVISPESMRSNTSTLERACGLATRSGRTRDVFIRVMHVGWVAAFILLATSGCRKYQQHFQEPQPDWSVVGPLCDRNADCRDGRVCVTGHGRKGVDGAYHAGSCEVRCSGTFLRMLWSCGLRAHCLENPHLIVPGGGGWCQAVR